MALKPRPLKAQGGIGLRPARGMRRFLSPLARLRRRAGKNVT
jgi:hypothetical protein